MVLSEVQGWIMRELRDRRGLIEGLRRGGRWPNATSVAQPKGLLPDRRSG